MAKPSINKLTYNGVIRHIKRLIKDGQDPNEATSNVIIDMPLGRLMRCLTYIAVEEGHDWHMDKTCDGTMGEQLAETLYEYIVDFVLDEYEGA